MIYYYGYITYTHSDHHKQLCIANIITGHNELLGSALISSSLVIGTF